MAGSMIGSRTIYIKMKLTPILKEFILSGNVTL